MIIKINIFPGQRTTFSLAYLTLNGGAAYLAGLSTGFYNSRDDIIQNRAIGKTFIPVLDEDTRLMLIKGWKRAVRSDLAWAEDET